jgi:hypothetical protein
LPVAELEKLSGETPLAYMLRILHDETQPADRRDRMAALAAPYVHPRQSNIMVAKTPFEMTDEELLATTARTELQLAEREGRPRLTLAVDNRSMAGG